jgi:cytochrome c556
MSLIRSIRLVSPILLAAALLAPVAQAQQTKGEAAVEYRQSILQVMAWNFGPMGAMAQGKVPYDAAEFAKRAERVAYVAPFLAEAFPPESQGVKASKLKAEAWAHRADLDAKLKDLIDRSATLATVAKGGDFEKSKAAFFDTANACKACHEKYRLKD